MAGSHLRRYDVQARYALVSSLASLLPFLAALWLAASRYDRDLHQIVYGAHGRFVLVFIGCVLVSMVPGSIGFVLGWSSAGQRRNDKPVRSWIGFFVGGAVVTFNAILLVAFYLLRLKHPV